MYGVSKDEKLDKLMDEWIAIIAKARDEDGYISTNIGHDRPGDPVAGFRQKRICMPILVTSSELSLWKPVESSQ